MRKICYNPMAQAYETAIDKLMLTQNIIRLTHVYKPVVSDLLMSFHIKSHNICT